MRSKGFNFHLLVMGMERKLIEFEWVPKRPEDLNCSVGAVTGVILESWKQGVIYNKISI